MNKAGSFGNAKMTNLCERFCLSVCKRAHNWVAGDTWVTAISAADVIREIEMDVHMKCYNMIFHLEFKSMHMIILFLL